MARDAAISRFRPSFPSESPIYNMKNKGFTIIGTSSAVQSAISSYIFSKDQIVAFYLAQEGFEQIRNLRDENRLKNRDWLYGIARDSGDPCYFGNACTVDSITAVIARCSGVGSCPPLRQGFGN